MKRKEEIEYAAELWNDQQTELEFGKPHNAPNRVKSFAQGYTKCQEDMVDKKYTEEDMLKCWNTAFIDAMNIDNETYKPIWYSDFINSLNKQDLPIINGSYGCTIETSKNKQD